MNTTPRSKPPTTISSPARAGAVLCRRLRVPELPYDIFDYGGRSVFGDENRDPCSVLRGIEVLHLLGDPNTPYSPAFDRPFLESAEWTVICAMC